MTKTRKTILNIVGWLMFAVVMALSLAIRFSHPELTETQLLINYLPVWGVVVVFAVAGIFMTTI